MHESFVSQTLVACLRSGVIMERKKEEKIDWFCKPLSQAALLNASNVKVCAGGGGGGGVGASNQHIPSGKTEFV